MSDDLHAGTDRYVHLSTAKNPNAFKGMPDFLLRSMDWYFARLWVHVTPMRMLWWPHGDLNAAPEEWTSCAIDVPPAAPAAPGSASAAPPGDWRPVARATLGRLPHHDLTTVDAAGHPLTVPVADATLTTDGVRLELPPGVAPLLSAGPACLTVHDHDGGFTWQHNAAFLGTLRLEPEPVLAIDRAKKTVVLPRGRLRRMIETTKWRRRYAPRLAAAAQRLGQPVPVVHTELAVRP